MEPLILALLTGLVLDQGDRAQQTVRRIAQLPNRGGPVALVGVLWIVTLVAIVASVIGAALSPHMPPRGRLLFFALALLFGGVGMLMARIAKANGAPDSGPGALLVRLLIYRIGDRAAFATVAVAALTDMVWASALGAALGGIIALVPVMSGVPLALPTVAQKIVGGVVTLAALVCALSALALL